jgi:hypothetical protein
MGPCQAPSRASAGPAAAHGLPDNDQLEEAVREYIELFCGDTQPQELQALRELALVWMDRLQEFRPHLAGAVWRGTATRLSDIYLQMFCDDPKSAEIALINHNVQYEPSRSRAFRASRWRPFHQQLCKPINESRGVHLLVYDHDRSARRAEARWPWPHRAGCQGLRKLDAGEPHE